MVVLDMQPAEVMEYSTVFPRLELPALEMTYSHLDSSASFLEKIRINDKALLSHFSLKQLLHFPDHLFVRSKIMAAA